MSSKDNDDFGGKVAFVTGAGSGIGRATALAFAAAGASVIAADRNPNDNHDTVELITSRKGDAIATTCDVTNSDDIQGALQQGIDRFGRLDIAFNNAGVELRPTPAADISEDDWDRVLDINLRGVFLCMKHEIPLLLEHGGGTIVNTSSGAGVKGFAGGEAHPQAPSPSDTPSSSTEDKPSDATNAPWIVVPFDQGKVSPGVLIWFAPWTVSLATDAGLNVKHLTTCGGHPREPRCWPA